MPPVVVEEKIEAAAGLLQGDPVPDSPRDQRLRPLPDVRVDRFIIERPPPQMTQRGVDAQGQVGLRVNERAVQIENQQSNPGSYLGKLHAVSQTGKVPQITQIHRIVLSLSSCC